jgi:hypothetical protein
MYKTFGIVFLLLLGFNATAQHKISFDAAVIRNMKSFNNGSNVSCFYHFTEKFTGGLEINTFYPAQTTVADEKIKNSAWDVDLNFHYLLPLQNKLVCYPLCGISHTSEKELTIATDKSIYSRFWSFNTGAGLLLTYGKWAPHIEYSYTWGHLNQQFLLAGISYELEWGNKRNAEK